MKLFSIIILVIFSVTSFAQQTKPKAKVKITTETESKDSSKMTTTTTTTETTAEPSATDHIKRYTEKSMQAADKALTESVALRTTKNYGLMLSYSPIDLIIPSKIGASFYFASDDKLNQYELQFLTSSISAGGLGVDVASVRETKFSFLNRNFIQHSNFNWFYGFSYATLEAKLGNDYLATVPANERPNADMLKLHVLALDLGMGNRWYYDNGLMFGIDWLGITQPISRLKREQHFTDYSNNSEDKDNVDKFLDIATFFPRIYTLKLQLGYSF